MNGKTWKVPLPWLVVIRVSYPWELMDGRVRWE